MYKKYSHSVPLCIKKYVFHVMNEDHGAINEVKYAAVTVSTTWLGNRTFNTGVRFT